MWGVADEVIYKGNWYVLQHVSMSRVRKAREAGREDALKDPQSAFAASHANLVAHGNHLRVVNSTLEDSIQTQREDYAELVQANARERAVNVLLLRQRGHTSKVSWAAFSVAVAAALVIGVGLGAASNF